MCAGLQRHASVIFRNDFDFIDSSKPFSHGPRNLLTDIVCEFRSHYLANIHSARLIATVTRKAFADFVQKRKIPGEIERINNLLPTTQFFIFLLFASKSVTHFLGEWIKTPSPSHVLLRLTAARCELTNG